MPVERRDVLFSFGEMSALLVRAAGRHSAHIRGSLSFLSVTEVIHTRDVPTSFHDKRTRMLDLLKEAPKGDGVIFRAAKPAVGVGTRVFGFFVPDDIMLDILLGECASLRIALPQRAAKIVLADDLNVGFRFVVDDNALELET
jgi:hypothetical protein